MTAPDLDAIRARADAATEGPWAWASRTTADGDEWAVFDPTDHALASNRDGWAPDAEFIAHAREDVPALLAEVEQLRADRDRWHLRWQQLMRDHEVVTAERDRAETIADRVEALADEWEAGQAVNRRALKNREFMPYEPPNPADLRAAIEGTDS